MSQVLVTAFGEDMETVFPIIKSFQLEKIILLATKDSLENANAFLKEFDKFGISGKTYGLKDCSIEEVFRAIKWVVGSEKGNEVIISVASGNKIVACLMVSAAFVNGLKAVGVQDGKVVLLPIMKFSYYKLLSGQKLKIMEFLVSMPQCCSSIEELSKQIGLSLPLLSYHLNGTPKAEGLKQMGLILTEEKGRKTRVELTPLGRMLVAGHL
ncbi:MAG: winged helix-turn-helix transcriptional regulator [Candidatus Diapherotrites archaeon]|nr:winged helix-turn-helix transcriptional regulator [Candidatus Diapherotrites archaeon]